MQKINIPLNGFKDGADGQLIRTLDVAIGDRTEFSAELFVRGTVEYRNRIVHFAGTVVLREGRDTVDHDIVLGGPERFRDTNAEAVAIAVMLALDEHASDLMETEMNRICG